MESKSNERSNPLNPFPQCVDCLTALARNAAALAEQKDDGVRGEIEAVARGALERGRQGAWSSPQIANWMLREIRRLSGVSDPYEGFKKREMAAAKRLFSVVKDLVGRDLRSCVSLAALGNSLDFFRDPDEALSEIPAQIKEGLSFYRDDVDRLEAFLAGGPETVLFLTDNAGEIYFDLPLYDYMRMRAKRVVLVVKGGPSLNDLTRAELKGEGLEGRFIEIADTGTDGAGVDWDRVSADFLRSLEEAQLVLSKGMANFETIFPKVLTPAVFFIFRVKCSPVQRYLDAPPNSFMAFFAPSERR